jgi:DNA-binding IclR family transcriptional regulator
MWLNAENPGPRHTKIATALGMGRASVYRVLEVSIEGAGAR